MYLESSQMTQRGRFPKLLPCCGGCGSLKGSKEPTPVGPAYWIYGLSATYWNKENEKPMDLHPIEVANNYESIYLWSLLCSQKADGYNTH